MDPAGRLTEYLTICKVRRCPALGAHQHWGMQVEGAKVGRAESKKVQRQRPGATAAVLDVPTWVA